MAETIITNLPRVEGILKQYCPFMNYWSEIISLCLREERFARGEGNEKKADFWYGLYGKAMIKHSLVAGIRNAKIWDAEEGAACVRSRGKFNE